jgi:hypothetical protein
VETLGRYTWTTARGNPAAGNVCFASEPFAGYANAVRVNDFDAEGNDRSTVLDNVADGDTVYIASRHGNKVRLFAAIVDGTPVNGAGFFGYPVTLPLYFDENDEPADDEDVYVLRVATANAGWPDVSELVLILDIAPDANVDVWATTLDRYLAAAINHVKGDVGRWDDAVNTPNDNLAGAALRMAELLATRPDGASTENDPAYQAFMTGQRKRFGLA